MLLNVRGFQYLHQRGLLLLVPEAVFLQKSETAVGETVGQESVLREELLLQGGRPCLGPVADERR